MESTIFSVRMDKKLKKNFNDLCDDFGISMSTAFTLFAKAVVREKKIPFSITSSKSEPTSKDFSNVKKVFEAIRKDYKKNKKLARLTSKFLYITITIQLFHLIDNL